MDKRTEQLMRENEALDQALSDENRDVLTDMVVYIRVAGISMYRQEQVRRDLTQMLLDAQERGVPASEVIGGDYQTFCDSVLAEVPQRSVHARALSACGGVCLCTGILAAIWFFFELLGLLTGTTAWPLLTVTAGQTAGMAVVLCTSAGIVAYICKTAFRPAKTENRKVWVVLVAVYALTLAVYAIWRTPLVKVNAYAAAVVILALFVLYFALNRVADRECD